MQKLDWLALAIAIALAWIAAGIGDAWLAPVERLLGALARRERLAVVGIGAAVILIRVALLPWMPVPEPRVHDEFSYLLAADTFVHGRLANPPHPLWTFFDTFHVLQHPTYASMYPPAQGAVLAVGKLLGSPWLGVLLSSAAMCMAITWMLQGWAPPEWALLGGGLALCRFAIFSYWTNSYWGGSVAAIGAALVLGALPRMLRLLRPRDAVICGVGAGILANSRPLEGFIFCVPVAVAILWWCVRGGRARLRTRVRRVLLPLAGCWRSPWDSSAITTRAWRKRHNVSGDDRDAGQDHFADIRLAGRQAAADLRESSSSMISTITMCRTFTGRDGGRR